MRRLVIGLFQKIEFYKCLDVMDEYKPIPAVKFLPEWYKKQKSYIGNEMKPDGKGQTTATIKKCMPVHDAMTLGYMLFTPVDLYITKKEDGSTWFEWPSLDIIEFHSQEQVDEYPGINQNVPKIINPWGIKTPKGYSIFFINPLHRPSPIRIFEGVVDCDAYIAPVNFPFQLNDPDFTGIIPAGTAIAQAIPFKRDSFRMSINNNLQEVRNITRNLKTKFFNGYKTFFWNRKEFQ